MVIHIDYYDVIAEPRVQDKLHTNRYLGIVGNIYFINHRNVAVCNLFQNINIWLRVLPRLKNCPFPLIIIILSIIWLTVLRIVL